MSGRFDARTGLRYAAGNLLKLIILFIAVVSLCAYALKVFSDSAGAVPDTGGLFAASAVYIVPFFLIPVIAFVAGGFSPGDPLRLVGRLAICAYMLAFLLILSGGMCYELHDVMLDGTTGAVAKSMSLTAVPDAMMLILALVPVLSAIDAVLEYIEPVTR